MRKSVIWPSSPSQTSSQQLLLHRFAAEFRTPGSFIFSPLQDSPHGYHIPYLGSLWAFFYMVMFKIFFFHFLSRLLLISPHRYFEKWSGFSLCHHLSLSADLIGSGSRFESPRELGNHVWSSALIPIKRIKAEGGVWDIIPALSERRKLSGSSRLVSVIKAFIWKVCSFVLLNELESWNDMSLGFGTKQLRWSDWLPL